MTHRERVVAAIQRKEVDRVPLFYRDEPAVEQRLRRDLGLTDREDLLRYLDIDFRWVEPLYVGPALDIQETGHKRDIWGVEFAYTSVGDGGYWEVVSSPLADIADSGALADYQWPSLEWFDFSVLRSQMEAYEGYAIMTAPGYSSPGAFTSAQYLMGMEKAMVDMLINPQFFRAITEHILEFALAFLEKLFEAANDQIDFLRTGDDYGTQRGLMIGIPQWREFVQPTLEAMNGVAKRHGAYHYHHSCGAIRSLIPDLIETGVDVLDPLQTAAVGMVPAELKSEFGSQLCFSGGVDSQNLLPYGTPQDIYDGVHSLLEDMARGGGFFIGPAHNFQTDVPTSNIIAMYEAAKSWHY